MILSNIHIIAWLSLALNQYLILFSSNPINSILFLILAFFNAFVIALLTKIEYLAFLFIIIYVGAIAVLFLFIIMMLNIKSKFFDDVTFFVLNIFSTLMQLLYYNREDNVLLHTWHNRYDQIINWDFLNDIYYFGQVLYNYYITLVVLAGFLLLLAIVGALSFTQDFNITAHSSKQKFRVLDKSNSKTRILNIYN